MKRKILTIGVISLFLLLCCQSLPALKVQTSDPDLTIKIQNVKYSNGNYTVLINISNIGGTKCNEDIVFVVKAYYKINNTFYYRGCCESTIADLDGGDCTGTFNVTLCKDTKYKKGCLIYAKVDPNDSITESEEANNNDQFQHKTGDNPRIFNNPVLQKISDIFSRVFSLFRQIFNK